MVDLRNLCKLILLLGVLLNAGVACAQLKIDAGHYQVDKNLRLIICNSTPDKVSAGTTSINAGKTYVFSSPINTIQLGTAYTVVSNDTAYKLYFTQLPIINVNVNEAISDDEVGGLINITDTTGASYNSSIGIKIRGNYSSTLPKKSYRVQLWKDSKGTTKDESVFGMRSDKRWLLLAMYNEKLRLNNRVSHELWLKLHPLYYADQEPNAHSTIRTRYVEIFVNNTYQGVYLFTEDMDRKQLQLKKQTTANTGGELYKGDGWDLGTMFSGVPALPTEKTELWGGWELSYPDADQTDWKSMYNFTDFVVNSSDTVFKQQISTKLREDNFADYFIFLNLLRAEDNQGKNLFLARYNETAPYFIAPWDLDGTWGYYWSGDQKNVTNDVLSNNLFNRLIATDKFKTQLATRWFSLRENLLSIDSLYAAIKTNHSFLTGNGVYERESLVWAGDYLSYGQDELDYVRTWTQTRVLWLDTYFKSLVSTQPMVYSFDVVTPASVSVKPTVQLAWSANCSAIQSFDIETSSDSLTWHTITPQRIMANDSTTCNYTFTDGRLEETVAYYRLKVIDKKSAVSYSSIRQVTVNLPLETIQIYPNPVSTTLQIQGDVKEIRIYSLLGACVYESPGSTFNTVDMQRFATGTYIVRVTQTNGLVSSRKLVVTK